MKGPRKQPTTLPDNPQLLEEVFDRSGWCLTFSLPSFLPLLRTHLSLTLAFVSPRADRSRPPCPPTGVVRELTVLVRCATPVFGCLFIPSYLQLMQRGGDLQGC